MPYIACDEAIDGATHYQTIRQSEARRGGWSLKLILNGTVPDLIIDRWGKSISRIITVVNWVSYQEVDGSLIRLIIK